MKRKKKKNGGKVQGFALLYGRSSRAIRIINGEKVGRDDHQIHSSKSNCGRKNKTKELVQKRYQMSEETKRTLDNLQDPIKMISRFTRAQKYEAANSNEKYEYGLSDW